jgi:hypothetical protein
VVLAKSFNPFTWWAKHEHLNIGFFAHQMMDIGGLQIEIEKKFNMVGVVIGLRHC